MGWRVVGGIPWRKSEAENRFLRYVLDVATSAGCTVEFRKVAALRPIYCNGYYSAEENRLVLAVAYHRWFEVVAHEFSHLLQMIDGQWTSASEIRAWDVFDGWLRGESNPRPARLLESTRIIQACELDADYRAMKLIRRWDLGIDLERYRRATNVYVLEHEAARQTRLWYDRPIYDSRLMALVPRRLITRFDVLPKGFLDEYVATARSLIKRAA